MKRALFLLPVVAFVALAALFAWGLTRDPSVLPSARVGQPLPAFALPSPAGGPGLASAALRGEPALLHVWASWCGVCRSEHPLLQRIAAEGTPLFGVAWKDEPAATARYLDQMGDPYRALGSDPGGRAGVDLGVGGVPETFVVDRRGVIRHRHVGPITAAVWDGELKPLLARLRAEA